MNQIDLACSPFLHRCIRELHGNIMHQNRAIRRIKSPQNWAIFQPFSKLIFERIKLLVCLLVGFFVSWFVCLF